ncbi:FKBP-type peptidyl-prolyl cis-trans isomerase [Flavobacterium sp. A45]|uniref:FKBP-type peptidyl-prolyl cis-trans isomerase n=1 Tax=Flavobacterium sp. A45 TaxID=1945862 RepID=UPI0009863E70|nr:hypothetical protein [Flavobacterium sp. A45]OOG75162.1 hypothetical protein B0E44_05260 [Flavobacterium sp. A45]
MSKIKFYFILLIATITMISCNKDDNNVEVTPPKPYAEQYPIDIATIESYLKANYITVVNNPGAVNDQDITIAKLDADHTVSIWDQNTYPLKSRIVKVHGIEYVLYYLVLREGVGESPCNVDGVWAAYRGEYLSSETVSSVTTIKSTLFEEVKSPNKIYDLYSTVRGWKEIFPQLKAGTYKTNPDGTVSYSDFGAAVMFIPSGLGYYNVARTGIPAYSPMVFNVKLLSLERLDHEFYMSGIESVAVPDGVKSFQEDRDGDGYMWTKGELQTGATSNPDDTDGDEIPDFLDRDDDGDDYATQGEVKDAFGKIYPFDLIPDCSGNQTNPDRIKRHLDKNCIKMSQ